MEELEDKIQNMNILFVSICCCLRFTANLKKYSEKVNNANVRRVLNY